MQMTGEEVIAASRQAVWDGLNDPDILARAIPGCQALEKEGDDRFSVVSEVKIGPIGARFKGNVQLSDMDPPNGCTITGSGNGGIAGTAKGGAQVRLSDAPGGGTLVSYEVSAEVGGRMAQLGGPIIDATAKTLAAKFFTKFGEVVSEGAGQPSDSAHAAAPAPAAGAATSAQAVSGPASAARRLGPDRTAPASDTPWSWVAVLVLALLVGYGLGQAAFGGSALLAVVVLVVVTAAVAYDQGRRGGRS